MGKGLAVKLGKLWCRVAHDDLGWPVQGHYRCRRCNRVFDVPWEDHKAVDGRWPMVDGNRPAVAVRTRPARAGLRLLTPVS